MSTAKTSKAKGARVTAGASSVSELMHADVVTAAPDEDAGVAWDRMRSTHVRHLIVVSDGKVVGVLPKAALSGPNGGARRRMGRKVGDLMGEGPVTTTPSTTLPRAAWLMSRGRLDCLPVVQHGALVGVLTANDLLWEMAHQAGESTGARPRS